MQILVQKFGGTSLSSEIAREHVLSHIQRELDRGFSIIVIVSAMGRNGDPYATDTLLEWIRANGDSLPSREKDMLMGCGEVISAATLCSLLHTRQIPAVVLNGAQAGIMTDDHFGNARIESIVPDRIINLLEQEKVVIVTGFQGQTLMGDCTTLGRGGSDTTATAIGAAVRAHMVDIYTDVNGILTADPRLVHDAQPLRVVSYTEICNMAHHGAKVIHPRAVEIAMQAQIPLRVRSTFMTDEGTLVTHPDIFDKTQVGIVDRFVTGIATMDNVTQITVQAKDSAENLQLRVFKAMAQHHISVDFINVTPLGAVYTVFDKDTEKAIQVLHNIGYHPKVMPGCAKVSVIGGGMNGVPGIMATIVEALIEKEIQILQSADSNTTIWVLVKREDMASAVRALHNKFELNK